MKFLFAGTYKRNLGAFCCKIKKFYVILVSKYLYYRALELYDRAEVLLVRAHSQKVGLRAHGLAGV